MPGKKKHGRVGCPCPYGMWGQPGLWSWWRGYEKLGETDLKMVLTFSLECLKVLTRPSTVLASTSEGQMGVFSQGIEI